MNLAKAALVEAGNQSHKYVRVRKKRGVQNILEFQLITKQEQDEMEKRNKARGEKIRIARMAKK
jgi:hypothetical protein